MKRNVRAAAACCLQRIVESGFSLHDALQSDECAFDARDHALLCELVYGVCRYYWRLAFYVDHLLVRPLKAGEGLVLQLIYVGLYQLAYCRLPDYAAISETVEAARWLNKPWAVGLINGVLRQFQRSRETLESEIASDDQAQTAHPRWLIERIRDAWPTYATAIFTANNAHPPLTLRVNRRALSREAFIQACEAKGLMATPHPHVDYAVTLAEAVPVDQIPGFWLGYCSVQDASSQWIERCLALQPGQIVLDACAAPGGKTSLLLEIEPSLRVCAIDQAPERLLRIKENLKRLKLEATLIAGDCRQPDGWWHGDFFDHILLDAPCSGSGVIRRHPDIKLLRHPSDISALAVTQLELLQALWPLLRSGGRLLYTTCSILPEENSHVIQSFLASCQDVDIIKLDFIDAVPCDVGVQVLPGIHHMDGFYYAVLAKR